MAWSGYNENQTLATHLCKYIGETVTVFTKSGGISGCGFTGVVLAVNCDFIRLVTQQGTAPACPVTGPNSSCCGDLSQDCNQPYGQSYNQQFYKPSYSVGSVCDIPFDKIAAFCHNAI